MLCPRCKKTVLAVTRQWSPRRSTATVEIHHDEDAKRWNLGGATRTCVIRMPFENSQRLMRKVGS